MNMISILLGATMLAVLASLLIGLVAMAQGGEFNRKYANRLMRIRVSLQGVAVVLFVLLMATR